MTKIERDDAANKEYYVLLELMHSDGKHQLKLLNGSNFLHTMDEEMMHELLAKNIRGYLPNRQYKADLLYRTGVPQLFV